MTARPPPGVPRIGVVTGLLEEAEALAAVRPDLAIVCRGVGPRRARRSAEALADAGATLLVSAGIAGGLDPARSAGDVVLADRILGADGAAYPADAAVAADWTAAAAAAGLVLHGGDVVGSDRVVPDFTAKMALYAVSGAAIVDMESHAVAAVAAERGLPVLALRAVSDGVRAVIPRAVIGAVARDGSRRPWVAVGGLARRPWQLRAVLALGRNAALARTALARVLAALPAGDPFAAGPAA